MPTSIKAIPVGAYPDAAWRIITGQSEPSDALSAYRTVAVIYRCVKVRAKAVRALPLALYRGRRDISETTEGLMELLRIRHLLGLGSASLCLYAAAYGLREQGRLTGIPYVRWVSSAAMKPQVDQDNGLTGIVRTLGGKETVLPLDRVWYAWHQDPASDVGPDVAPVDVAAAAAGVLGSLDELKAAYFAGGAIRPTLIKVPPATGEQERKKLQAWWDRLRGKKNAFNVQVVGADVNHISIGDNLRDVLPDGVEDRATMAALVAMEVPASLVLPDAANYATAKQDALNFLDHVTLPDAELLIDTLNSQHYGLQGLEIRALPERLEVRQASELEKAQTVASLTQVPVLTQSEARQLIDREPLEADTEEVRRLTVAAQLQIMQAARDAGYSVAEAAALAGLPAPEEPPPPPPASALPPPPPAGAAGDGEDDDPNDDPDDDTPPPARALDLQRWQRKAEKRLAAGKRAACGFESPYIDPYDAELIGHALEHATTRQEVRAAFALKAPGQGLTPAERTLWVALRDVLEAQAPAVLAAILAGEVVDLAGLPPALQAAIVPALTSAALDVATGLAESIGPDFDPAQFATTASEWALQHSGELVRDITDTTRQLIQTAVAAYQATPGMTQGDLERLLQAAFSPRRAETIAITEITRAAAEATNVYQAQLAAAGLRFVRVWNTVNAGDVCAVCGPLDGKTEDEWGKDFPRGAPAHPRCRCSISLRRVRA